jgi:uncharacterized membrane protein YhdT
MTLRAGLGGELKRPVPPTWMESAVGRIIPQAYRDTVLGDLRERYRSGIGYLADAATAVPASILCQIRRSRPFVFLVLEALTVFGSFLAAGFLQRWADGDPNASQIAGITVVVMAGLLWRDAYGQPNKPSWLRLPRWLKLVFEVYLPIYFSCAATWIWGLFHPKPELFPRIMTVQVGMFFSAAMISLVRLWIESLREDRPRGTQ